jgi:DNA-binding transcriptional LysR family regulator
MAGLPDFEAMAILAKVAEFRSFARAAADLGIAKATVSKAIARLERRLGLRLFNRTSRRLALTEAGRRMAERAARMIAEGEAAESETLAEASQPRGLVRLAAPMSFGLRHIAPILADFLARYPEIAVDLHLSDAEVDLIGDGFDLALRIATLPDSSLIARRLCGVARHLVAAPAYLARRGRPQHPTDLTGHACLGYAYLPTPETWRFVDGNGATVAIHPKGPLRANNADALTAALHAGLGLALQPDFIAAEDLKSGRLESVMTGWSVPLGGLHLLRPPGGPNPARVDLLSDFIATRLARPNWQVQPPPAEPGQGSD